MKTVCKNWWKLLEVWMLTSSAMKSTGGMDETYMPSILDFGYDKAISVSSLSKDVLYGRNQNRLDRDER